MKSLVAGCREHRRHAALSRRSALKLGAVGGLGLTLADVMRHEAVASSPRAKAKSVILLWLQGGVSHHDTFDMKPYAPDSVRGEFSPISTNLPGVFISELLPQMSQIMDRLTLIRSMTHVEGAHQRGSIYMVEGRRPKRSTGVEASGHPHMGCMVNHQLGMRNGVPAYVSIPGNDFTSRFVGPGYLPPSCGAFKGTNSRTLTVNDRIDEQRFGDRLKLREQMGEAAASAYGRLWDTYSEQAFDIIHSGEAASAFDISQESEEIQRLYGVIDSTGGKTRGAMPTLCLQARRLVEAGVRFVTVGRNSWDHHSDVFNNLRRRVPRNDRAISGLILDLEQRGLLDETLVVYATEFGRTPRINPNVGRDHWPRVFSVAFAGGGTARGKVIGASDEQGGEPADRPVSPEQFAATILHLVGIEPQTEVITSGNRPVRLIDQGQPVPELLA